MCSMLQVESESNEIELPSVLVSWLLKTNCLLICHHIFRTRFAESANRPTRSILVMSHIFVIRYVK